MRRYNINLHAPARIESGYRPRRKLLAERASLHPGTPTSYTHPRSRENTPTSQSRQHHAIRDTPLRLLRGTRLRPELCPTRSTPPLDHLMTCRIHHLAQPPSVPWADQRVGRFGDRRLEPAIHASIALGALALSPNLRNVKFAPRQITLFFGVTKDFYGRFHEYCGDKGLRLPLDSTIQSSEAQRKALCRDLEWSPFWR